jgi:hypothetical protein
MQITDWILHLEGLAARGPRGAADLSSPVPPDPTLLAGPRGEQVLWRAATAATAAFADPALDELLRAREGRGSLLATDAFLAIEVWAECELAALHALHRLLRVAQVPVGDWRRARLAEAAAWHLEHTQPDNSTNRPWALHVYLLRDDPTGESRLYAETLLHNACASSARDEPLSRWILADAARELRLALGSAQPAR